MGILTPGIIIAQVCGLTAGAALVERIPYPYVRRRRSPRPKRRKKPPEKCSCKAFKYCDEIYQASSGDFRLLWARAVSKQYMSSYDLWMKECLTLTLRGDAPPDIPSPSGGHSTNHLIPGDTYPGLEICGAPPPAIRWSCDGAPDWTCSQDPDGDYDTEAACLAECFLPRWSCSGHPFWTCYLDPDGEYETIDECLELCAAPRWDCTGAPLWNCIPIIDGEYETEDECIAACVYTPPERWPPGNDCDNCSEDTPSKTTCVIAGLTGAALAWNGTYILDQKTGYPCQWEKIEPDYGFGVHRYFANGWDAMLTLTAPGNYIQFLSWADPSDCYESTAVPYFDGAGIFAGQAAATCTISGLQP